MAKIRIKALIMAMSSVFLCTAASEAAVGVYTDFSGSTGKGEEAYQSETQKKAEPYEVEEVVKTTVITKILEDGTVITETFEGIGEESELRSQNPVKLPEKKSMSKFMIGLELGTCLDISSSDLSTFNAEALVGYRHKAIQLLGVMFGIHKSLGSRDTFIPVSLVFRTGFRQNPTLFFLHFNAGYSFNTVSRSSMFGDVTATLGCGINLVQRPKFQSNIVAGFGFRHFTRRHQQMAQIFKSNVGFAQISLGISM